MTYGRVTLLGLAGLLGEDDQPAPVFLEPLDVDLLALLGPSVPPVVNDDTQTLGLLPGDTGLLQLGEGEPSAEPDLGVVSLSRGTDSRSEQLEGSDSEGQSLLLTSDTPGVLSAGLVEPGLDTLLQPTRQKGNQRAGPVLFNGDKGDGLHGSSLTSWRIGETRTGFEGKDPALQRKLCGRPDSWPMSLVVSSDHSIG